MLNFAEQTGSGAVIVVWSFLQGSNYCEFPTLPTLDLCFIMPNYPSFPWVLERTWIRFAAEFFLPRDLDNLTRCYRVKLKYLIFRSIYRIFKRGKAKSRLSCKELPENAIKWHFRGTRSLQRLDLVSSIFAQKISCHHHEIFFLALHQRHSKPAYGSTNHRYMELGCSCGAIDVGIVHINGCTGANQPFSVL